MVLGNWISISWFQSGFHLSGLLLPILHYLCPQWVSIVKKVFIFNESIVFSIYSLIFFALIMSLPGLTFSTPPFFQNSTVHHTWDTRFLQILGVLFDPYDGRGDTSSSGATREGGEPSFAPPPSFDSSMIMIVDHLLSNFVN